MRSKHSASPSSKDHACHNGHAHDAATQTAPAKPPTTDYATNTNAHHGNTPAHTTAYSTPANGNAPANRSSPATTTPAYAADNPHTPSTTSHQ